MSTYFVLFAVLLEDSEWIGKGKDMEKGGGGIILDLLGHFRVEN